MKKIDIHAHVTYFEGIPYAGRKPYMTHDTIRPYFEKYNTEKFNLLPAVNPDCAYQIQSNEEAMQLVLEHPDKYTFFCNVDPRMANNSSKSDLSYHLEYYKGRGALGVGEICANLEFDHPLLDNLFTHCEKTNMPVLFHIAPKQFDNYGIIDDLHLPRLESALNKHPDLKFIGHSQPFWAEIGLNVNEQNRNGYPKGKVNEGRLVTLLRKYHNLYCDLSAGSGYNAVSRDPQFGYDFMEEFQDRIFYGTDLCFPGHDDDLSAFLDNAKEEGKISQIAYQKIIRVNFEEILINKTR